MDGASSHTRRLVENWKLKLIDLSRRNRLIYFRPTKRSNIRIERPKIKTIFERLVIKGKNLEIWTPPLEEGDITGIVRKRRSSRPRKTQLVTAEMDALQLEKTLRNLSRRSASEYRERGVRILYVTFGILKWKEDGSPGDIKSPIVLTPVELTRKTPRDPYQIHVPSVEEEVILNPALMLKMKNDFKIELPLLPDFEEQNLTEYLEAVAKSGAELGWSMEPAVQIGLFSFHKLVMYQDLSDNIDIIMRHQMISALAGRPKTSIIIDSLPLEKELDKIVEPKQTFQVLDADSSQQLCIQYALRGQSFVMHGPPGTGKSQTIANIISEFIAAGKSVLFVSEKMAALDVVYNRLTDRGLDDFCLELHSHKANKREVVAELSRCLTEHLKPSRTISDAELERLRTRRDQLNNYVEALHKRHSPSEMTAFELLGKLTQLEDIPFVPSGYLQLAKIDQKKLFELEELVRRLTNAWTVVEEGMDFPWRGCTDKRFTPETRSEWITLLERSSSTILQMSKESLKYAETLNLPLPKKLADYEWLRSASNLISNSPRPPERWLVDTDLEELEVEAEKNRREYDEYWSARRNLEKFYDSHFIRTPLGTAERIENSWTRVRELLALPTEGDGGLLRYRNELAEYVGDFPEKVKTWKKNATRIGNILGLEGNVESIRRIRQLSELASLCEEREKPKAAWLNKRTLKDTRMVLNEVKSDLKRRDELRKLIKDYREELLELDLNQYIDWFKGLGRSVLRYFMPSFYRIKGVLTNIHRTGRIPESILEDLRAAKDLVEIEARIKSQRDDARRILGTYYPEDESDIKSAERALKTAERALKIVGKAQAPEKVVDNISVGSEPREDLLKLGRDLKSSLTEWKSTTRKLSRLIPSRRLPTTGKSLLSSRIQGVTEWAIEVTEKLNILSRISGEVLSYRTSDYPSTFGVLLSDLRKAEELQSFEAIMDKRYEELQNSYGKLYTSLTTKWNEAIHSIEWTRRFRRLFRDCISPALVEAVSYGGHTIAKDPEVSSKLDGLYQALEIIENRFEQHIWAEPRSLLDLDDVLRKLREMLSRVDELQTWSDYKDIEARFREAGLGGFLATVAKLGFDRAQLIDIFHKSMYQGLVDKLFEGDPVLNEFRGRGQEQIIDDFKDLDQRFIQLSSQRVIERANQKKPQGVFIETPDSEITILQREAVKKRRHLPLRHLFARISGLLLRLKPCLLMSPISVSQFLIPDKLHFDLVVFDEASQIYTEDAVGAIYRGNQLLVAGDNKQLPPTNFFQHQLDEDFDWDESEYEFDVFDSVLDECIGTGLPVNMLRWHYRSKHDSLINFSNERFYDRRLFLFPSARRRDEALGLKFVHVSDGVYNRGSTRNNPQEAEVVADQVFDHFTRHPEKSLGVVTFNISQMNTIQDILERRLSKNPEYQRFFVEDRLHGFFVKNLENVQGDERDVMVLSVGYGYDRKGNFTMNFGPLNKPGGERRLNVAITRAREKVILVSSIKSSDINLGTTKADGVRNLYHYLMYAEKGTETTVSEEYAQVKLGSPIAWDVGEEIRRLGFWVKPLVGSSSFRVDLGVIDPKYPDRFIMGILCDGETYRSASTARDRDRLRQSILENLGWRIYRIWSPDWVQRRETELKRLEEALKEFSLRPRKNRTLKTQRPTSEQSHKMEVIKDKVQEINIDRLPEVVSYSPSKLRPRHLFSRYSPEFKERYLGQYRSEVQRLLPIIVMTEGPIHLEYAFKRINACLRLRRTTSTFKNIFNEVLDDFKGEGLILVRGEFLWPNSRVDVNVRIPVKGIEETFRPIRYIPLDEIRSALTLISTHSLGLTDEPLIRETARLLGFKRMGINVRAVLDEALQSLIDEGVLTRRDGCLTRSDGE